MIETSSELHYCCSARYESEPSMTPCYNHGIICLEQIKIKVVVLHDKGEILASLLASLPDLIQSMVCI